MPSEPVTVAPADESIGSGPIRAERVGSTEVITLHRPAALNALSTQMLADLPAALAAAGRDRSCRSILLTGAGDRAFCAGIDVKAVASRDAADAPADHNRPDHTRPAQVVLDPVTAGFENLHLVLSGIVRTIHTLPIPVIAAVNGHAVGAGFAIAAACDLRVAGETATFSDGFVKRGISGCEMGLSYFLPKIVGPALAFDLMMTGRRLDAVAACRHGLVSEVVPSADLVETALALGATFDALAPMAVSMTKEVMWANLHAGSLDQALALESRTQTLTRATADAAEARRSFLEKRTPVFGRSDAPRPIR